MKTKHRPSCIPPSKTGGKPHAIINGARSLVAMLGRLPQVQKIHPSRINPLASGHPRVKIQDRQFGINVKVICNEGCQEINVVTNDKITTERAIHAFAAA